MSMCVVNHKRPTHNKVVVSKRIRVSLLQEVFADGNIFWIFTPVGDDPSGAGVEPEHIVDHSPHVRIQKASSLTKHGGEAFASPFEQASVAGYAESHFCLGDFDLWEPLEKPQEIRVGIGVEDDLQNAALVGWDIERTISITNPL